MVIISEPKWFMLPSLLKFKVLIFAIFTILPCGILNLYLLPFSSTTRMILELLVNTKAIERFELIALDLK